MKESWVRVVKNKEATSTHVCSEKEKLDCGCVCVFVR